MNIPKMISTPTQVTLIANAAYHGAVVGGLTISYAKIGHMLKKYTPVPKLDVGKYDTGLAIRDIGLAIWTKIC